MGNLLSGLFVKVHELPHDGQGLVQVIFLGAVYAFILMKAGTLIQHGSELLLLIPSISGLVGGCLLPVLGCVPDGAVVLFSGLGADAQRQLQVGIGALAGSTVLMLSLLWAMSMYAGRVDWNSETRTGAYKKPDDADDEDDDENEAKNEGKDDKKKKPWSKLTKPLLETGVNVNDQIVRRSAVAMIATMLPLFIIQIPAAFAGCSIASDEASCKTPRVAAIAAAVGTFICFVGYLADQLRQVFYSKNIVVEGIVKQAQRQSLAQRLISARALFYLDLVDKRWSPVGTGAGGRGVLSLPLQRNATAAAATSQNAPRSANTQFNAGSSHPALFPSRGERPAAPPPRPAALNLDAKALNAEEQQQQQEQQHHHYDHRDQDTNHLLTPHHQQMQQQQQQMMLHGGMGARTMTAPHTPSSHYSSATAPPPLMARSASVGHSTSRQGAGGGGNFFEPREPLLPGSPMAPGKRFEQFVRKLFKRLDKDKSGHIERHDLVHLLKDLGEPTDTETVNRFLAECDLDSDGRISFKDFLMVMHDAKSSMSPAAVEAAVTAGISAFDQFGSPSTSVSQQRQHQVMFGGNSEQQKQQQQQQQQLLQQPNARSLDDDASSSQHQQQQYHHLRSVSEQTGMTASPNTAAPPPSSGAASDAATRKEKKQNWKASYGANESSSSSSSDDEEAQWPLDLAHLPPEQQRTRVVLRSLWQMSLGVAIVLIFTDPLVDVIDSFALRTGIHPFIASFVIAPGISSGPEIVSSFVYSSKKTINSATISFSALLGTCAMNCSFCVFIFLMLVIVKDLRFVFAAELASIIVSQLIMFAYVIFFKGAYSLKTIWLPILLMPAMIGMVVGLQAAGWD